MITEVFNRVEKKFLLDSDTYELLLKKLDGYVKEDKHSKGEEFYNICNVYYDTQTDELIRSSIEKPEYKEKFRLRSYGVPGLEDNVFLEIKKKYKGVVNKRRTVLPLSDAYKFINNGITPKLPNMNKQIINEITFFLKQYEIVPKLYLAYDRKAFYAIEDESVRITFDTNIRTRRYNLKLDLGNAGVDLLDKDMWLMEVKVSNAIPMWLTKILSECKVYSTSFSKYGTEYKKFVNNKINLERGEELCSNQFSKVQQTQHLALGRQFLVS